MGPIRPSPRDRRTLVLRRIGYREKETGKRFKFLAHHMTLPARAIAGIDKDRRQVDIFLRFIEQNLEIESFRGNSKNAVPSRGYVALMAYLRLACRKVRPKIGLHCLARPVQ